MGKEKIESQKVKQKINFRHSSPLLRLGVKNKQLGVLRSIFNMPVLSAKRKDWLW